MANINLSLEGVSSLSVERDFRQDINLLRGIAILSVVFYHFAAPLLPGGFAGVDVFFVISGFLMTKIIATGLERNRFNLIQFYAARCKRIIPALLTMCLVIAVATFFWLPTNEYKKLGNYIGYAALFISNLKLRKETGDYFALDSHENWFLHTWSLSVEWQFYLVLPFIMMGLYPLRKKLNTGLCLLVLTVASFSVSIMHTPANASTSFYLMPYRAWEMLCGGLVWYAAQRFVLPSGIRPFTAIAGYVLILFSLFYITADQTWPGPLTLLPVLGAMLVIYSDYQPLVSLFDRNFRWAGLSSYSVYLWHWPVVVFLIYSGRQHNGLWVMSAIALSFALGWLSWVLIEQPGKSYLNQRSSRAFWLILLAGTGAAWLFSYLVKHDIVVSQPDPLVNKIALEATNKNYAANPKTHLSTYGTGKPVAIIIGDSHAEATATALAAATEGKGSVIGITYSGCPTLAAGELGDNTGCGAFNRSLPARLKDYPSDVPVVVVNRLTHYAEQQQIAFDARPQNKQAYLQQYADAIVGMACTLNRAHPVWLVNPIPEMAHNVPRTLSHRLMTGAVTRDLSVPLADYEKKNATILQAQARAAKQCGVQVLDPTAWLCTSGRCMGSKNLSPWYFDDNHLSETGNKILVPMFRQVFDHPQK